MKTTRLEEGRTTVLSFADEAATIVIAEIETNSLTVAIIFASSTSFVLKAILQERRTQDRRSPEYDGNPGRESS